MQINSIHFNKYPYKLQYSTVKLQNLLVKMIKILISLKVHLYQNILLYSTLCIFILKCRSLSLVIQIGQLRTLLKFS